MSFIRINCKPVDNMECIVEIEAEFGMGRADYPEFEKKLNDLIDEYRI